MDLKIWHRYLGLVRRKKKPLSHKNKEWIKSLGPYVEVASGVKTVRISTTETRKDAREKFGEVFIATLFDPTEKDKDYSIVIEPKLRNSGDTLYWLSIENKDEAKEIHNDIFSGTRNLEDIEWEQTT